MLVEGGVAQLHRSGKKRLRAAHRLHFLDLLHQSLELQELHLELVLHVYQQLVRGFLLNLCYPALAPFQRSEPAFDVVHYEVKPLCGPRFLLSDDPGQGAESLREEGRRIQGLLRRGDLRAARKKREVGGGFS